ncbi:dihydrofolate reductase family protein [Phycicoccus sp. KQZ13P-1]|uniref:dihydrofolate reductase family protein n=1 Tax=Phycicoccus mangrovi TaxID=2840470 RepID=UPI001BFFDDDD|nr:dihydrofolate reductase family protein [Phycicoccus mangrovi]MBT9255274.1 dihydrofolate reductase family protein [Phycicoccus mangrovi]
MNDVIAFASVSVDGFSSGPDNDLRRLHQWMYNFDTNQENGYNDHLIAEFRTAGVVVFGRTTFDAGQEPWGDDDVFSSPVVVVTREALEPVQRNGALFTFTSGSAQKILDHARQRADGGTVVIMGSASIIQQFLKANLIDVLMLHQVPVLLGRGTRLFSDDGVPAELDLELFEPGPHVTQLKYALRRSTEGSTPSAAT